MHTVSTFPRTRRARRRQMAWGVLLWAAGAVLFVLTVLASWRVGRSQVEIEILRLQADLAAQHDLNRLLSVRAAAAEQQAEGAIARHAQLLQRQRSQAPSPELRHLTELADEKLRAGVSVSRLEFVLGQAEIEPICDREIEIHRMTVQTASGPSPVASAGFFGNRVIVTGETSAGQGADLSRSGTGAARIVNLRFLEIGGDVATASGPLPLAHALSVEGEELRFAVRSSDRSADELEISAQRCRLP